MYCKVARVSSSGGEEASPQKEERKKKKGKGEREREREREVVGWSGGEYCTVVQGISNNYLRALDEIAQYLSDIQKYILMVNGGGGGTRCVKLPYPLLPQKIFLDETL